METSPARQRLGIVVAIVCGTLASVLLWKALGPKNGRYTEEQAQKLGYASADDATQTRAFIDQTVKKTRMSENEFTELERALAEGSRARRGRTIVALGFLKGDDQHRRTLAMLDRIGMREEERVLWKVSLQRWARYQNDPSALSTLKASGHPEVRKIAKEIEDEK